MHFKKTFYSSAFAAVILFCGPSVVQAALLVTPYAITFNSLDNIVIPDTVQFDPALGTLNSIETTVAIDWTFTADYTYIGGASGQVPPVGSQVTLPQEQPVTYAAEIIGPISNPENPRENGVILSTSTGGPISDAFTTGEVFDFGITQSITSTLTSLLPTNFVANDGRNGPRLFGQGIPAKLTASLLTFELDAYRYGGVCVIPSRECQAANLVDITNVTWNARVYGDVTSTFTPAAVPIPAAAWLFGSGLLGLIGIARCKKA